MLDTNTPSRTVAVISTRLRSMGLTWTVERDWERLADFLGRYLHGPMNPSFDPKQSDLDSGSFWIGTWSGKELIASRADRWWPDADYDTLLRYGHLFSRTGYGDGLAAGFYYPLPSGLEGRICHAGSLYVRPDWRGAHLSKLLPRLGRALADITVGFDVYTAVVFDTLYRHGLPQANYGYPHWQLCFDGHFPAIGKPVKVHACWMTKAESRADLAEWLQKADGDSKQCIDLPVRRPA